MRKNKTMRAAAGLLVATLLTTSVISGTFAKYTTSASGDDSARVAKWGVTVKANGTTFAKEYAKTDKSFTLATNSVVAAGATDEAKENVIAPGTSGQMAKMELSGTPEVAVKVSYAGEFKLDGNWTIKEGTEDKFYCPLIITVKSNTEENGTVIKQSDSVNTVQAFNQAVNDAIAAYSKEYQANTDLSSTDTKNDSLTVSWEWPFAGTGNNAIQTDAKDTALGNIAADVDATTTNKVTLKVTTTVTQID